MKNDLFIKPSAFTYGQDARRAIDENQAYPFVGQRDVAFSMVQKILCVHSESLYVIGSQPDKWQNEIIELTQPLPLAGLPSGPLIMGILNVTPDSFSDGGQHYQIGDAVRAGHQMVQDGASIIDIGGESTRPDSFPITPEEECKRILPVIQKLKGCGALISVDTRHAYTMSKVLDAGVDIINDVSALDDPQSASIIAQANCPVILMHMRGTPQTMQDYAQYNNVTYEVLTELQTKINYAVSAGIDRSNIIVDPGVGFAKNKEHNLALIKSFAAFANLGCRVLLAVSRKRFIRETLNDIKSEHYDWGTIVSSLPFMLYGNGIVRVHDVSAMMQSIKIWQALHSS